MKTMLNIAVDVIAQETTKIYTFEEIFNEVEKQLSAKWKNQFVNENRSYDDIRRKKMGELYRLLTVDHRFKHEGDNTWKSSTFELKEF